MSPPAIYYAAFLTPASREALLRAHPPRYPRVTADHVTLCFRPTGDGELRLRHLVGERTIVRCLWETWNERVQALCVELPLRRLDGKRTHLTISTTEGARPAEAGPLIDDPPIAVPTILDLVAVVDRYPRSINFEK